ncbi:MAG TPA: carboxypeptidase regulatory-like domain-containing protein, partial [Candidatus Limnocylindrales bacterium]|nr:carboxypeptidase regulatory-like domain-containing protein [Candidatus Limnocylindrales bacterium]
MNVLSRSVFAFFLFSLPAFAQTKSAAPPPAKTPPPTAESHSPTSVTPSKLPVRRVVLYKNGIGFFEHLGSVHGSQDVHIDFTSSQLNDVLNSLTVLDLSGGRITGVDYNSEAPLARRLATLRLALGEKPTQAEFLSALRGARIEVRSGAAPAVTGKLLSIERKTRSSTTFTVETEEISLITDAGEVRSVDLNPTTSVRILDGDLKVEVGRYLGLIAASRDQDVRRMTLSTTGTGERNLYVSYISEVPVWKTTYRIVLPNKADKKPLLQGWAIVDNTVGEDWNNVELSLVAGAPHSFIQQLSEPYYSRRPVVPLPESVQLSPQTHAATLSGGNGHLSGTITDASGATIPAASVRLLDENGAQIASTFTDGAGNYSFSSLPVGNYRLESQRSGFKTSVVSNFALSPGENQINSQLQVGTSSQAIEVSASTSTMDTSTSAASSYLNLLPGVANRPR